MTSFALGMSLLAWGVLGFALVRRAERLVAITALPTPWVSLTCASVLGAVALALRPYPQAALCGVACIGLTLAACADHRTGFLFDAVTFPMAVLVAALAIASHSASTAAFGVALLVVPFGTLVVATRGRLLGLGDVKAMYAVGAAFGPLESLVAIFAACVSGIVAAGLAGRLHRGAELRFGPHLAIGSAFALVAGGPIARYLSGTA